ncbi:MAG: DUF1801 domain-containing protein [Bacteroidia bacterium]
MNIQEEIKLYLKSIPEPKQKEMQVLHDFIIQINPTCKLGFFNGKDENGKTVSNPTITYGELTLVDAKGNTAISFQIGLSANKSGISIYLLGIKDKSYLTLHFSNKIGQAHITGYCIKFKTIQDIEMTVLKEILTYGFSDKN